MPLSDVSLLVTAGHRPGYLQALLKGVAEFLPEATTIVVTDDGKGRYHFPTPPKTLWRNVPDGTFLTAKRNRAVEMADTRYSVMLADDFEITADTRRVIIEMMNLLDAMLYVQVVGGTFNGNRYEGFLEVVPGKYIKETALDTSKDEPYGSAGLRKNIWKVDITVNFFMARTNVLRRVPWDESIGPIGGEHADWFLDLKAGNELVVWTPGLNINEQPKDPEKEASYYGSMRRKVWDGHALMLKKRGVKRYIGFGDNP